MYESFYNLKEKPFDLHPDPDYLFMSQGHDNAFTLLEYAIAENKGFVVITGEIGAGKTTLINFFLHKVRQDIQVGLINNTSTSLNHFVKMMCQEFELEVEGLDKVEMLYAFHEFLLTQYAEKKRVLLIIDEAQNLTPEVLEEIRMLSNLEAEKHHLIQIILVGQPELKYSLQRKDLEQFVQRVTVHCHLGGLNKEETELYIRYRLKMAGAVNPDIFQKDAIEIIFKYSNGIPRLINILCDTALVYGFADSHEIIGKNILDDVIKEREAGGMFSVDSPDEKTAPLSQSTEAVITEHSDIRLILMEQRISMFEVMLEDMGLKLDKLSGKKDERDDIILELFKMLKNGMESRGDILERLKQISKGMENPRNKPIEIKKEPRSLFSLRLKRKK
jgi:general secretion pathway protein A